MKKFALAISMQIHAQRSKQDLSRFPKFKRAIQDIEDASVPALACTGWRTAGKIHIKAGDSVNANLYYQRALSIARKYKLELLERQLYVSFAGLNEQLSRFDKAKEYLNRIKPVALPDPIIPTKLEILAVIAAKEGNMEESVALVKKALDISLQLDHVSLIPDECLYLGESYENHFGDYEQAEKYYRMGYEHSIRYAEHGISLTGDRKKVVDAYTSLLANKKKLPPAGRPKKQSDPFAFAQGKTWKEIKDIFQYELLRFHTQEGQSNKQLAQGLGMPPTTLYSLQDRLKKRGFLLPATTASSESPHELQPFLIQHDALSWEAANQIFEQEMMHYLYEKYGYNKHRMAIILKLSYPSIIEKTREITQVNDQYLPN